MPEIENDGVRIFFEDHGDGPPIVLGHSFLCSGEMWGPQIGPLSERYRVINVDHRGHGNSGQASAPFEIYDMVDDVVAVLDELEIAEAVWCGLSIGGMVAMRAALTVKDRVCGLVLADTHAGPETRFKKIKYEAMNLGARIFGMRRFLPAVVPLMFGETTLRENPDLVAEWREHFVAMDLTSVGTTLGALVRRDPLVDRLRDLSVPSLVIVGAEDVSLPVRCSEEIASAIPGAELKIIPKAGHLSALEQPEAVSEAMLGFLEKVYQ